MTETEDFVNLDAAGAEWENFPRIHGAIAPEKSAILGKIYHRFSLPIASFV
jgi:hypothetical protein